MAIVGPNDYKSGSPPQGAVTIPLFIVILLIFLLNEIISAANVIEDALYCEELFLQYVGALRQ